MPRDTFGIKLAAEALRKYAELPEKATLNRRLNMLGVKFPEYKNVFQKTKLLITGKK